LRNYFWEPTPGAPLKPPWDDGEVPKKRDDSKIEETLPDRIGLADRDNPKFEYFKDQWAHLSKQSDDWGVWEFFCFKMVAAIERIEPHYPDFIGLLVTILSPCYFSLLINSLHCYWNKMESTSTNRL